MTDIRSFLARGAASPTRSFDVVALVAAERSGRRRRTAGWLGGIAAALALAGGAGSALAPAASPALGQRGTPSVSADPPAPLDGGGGGEPGDADRAGAERRSGAATQRHTGEEAAVPPAPSPLAPTLGTGGPETSPREQVSAGATPDPGEVEPGAAIEGCSLGRAATCEYRATRPGGYVGQGVWRLSITRAGVTYVFDSSVDDWCRDIGFVVAGDVVRATTSQHDAGLADDAPGSQKPRQLETRLEVGPEASCR